MSSLKVLHVVTRNQARGAERVAASLASHLASYGWEQRTVALLPGPTGQGDLGLTHLAESIPGAIGALRRELRRTNPDVVLAHGGTAAACAVTAGLGLHTPVVWQRILELPPHVWRTPALARYWGGVARRCAGVIALSEKAAAEMRQLRFEGPVEFIPNHRPILAPGSETRPHPVLESLRGEGAHILGFVGHLVEQKDPVAAVRTAERVLKDLPEAHAVLVGDGPLTSAVRHAVAASQVADRFHLLGHVVDVRTSVLPLLDALLITSRTESMTGVAVEAVMAGCPVASYELDGLDLLLRDTGAGILVPVGDEVRLADALIEILTDQSTRDEMAASARREGRNFSTEKVAGDYDRFLRAVIAGTRPESNASHSATPRTVIHLMPNIGVGGAEQSLAVLARFHDRNRWRPVVVTLHAPRRAINETVIPELKLLDVPVISLDLPGRADRSPVILARATRTLRSVIQERGADIVDSALFEADITARLAVLGLPVGHVTHLVNTTYNDAVRSGIRGRGQWRFEAVRTLDALSGRRTDAFIALTEAVQRSATRALGIAQDRFDIIPRGVDTDRFSSRSERLRPIRRLVTVGRLVPQKNHLMLIEALRHTDDLTLTLLGEGPLHDEIADSIMAAGLSDRVELHSPTRDVLGVLAEHDAFVLPSLWEGQSNALLEAMSMGMPILASDIPVLREVLGEQGLFASAENARDFAAGLVALSELTERERDQLGGGARARVVKHYSGQTATRRLEGVYDRVVRRRKGR